MPPFDDDSSSDEDYTETNVLLGYALENTTEDNISHLGGHPTWIDSNTAPSGALAKCKVCNGLLTLLLELNGDLPQDFPGHERRLYIWSCRRKPCRRKSGSIRALRGVRISIDGELLQQPKAPKAQGQYEDKQQPRLGESLFGVKSAGSPLPSANPFSSSATGITLTNPFATASANVNSFASKVLQDQVPTENHEHEPKTSLSETFASKLRIGSPPENLQPARSHEPWPVESAFPPPYVRLYLDAGYELLDDPAPAQLPDNIRMDVDGEGSGSGGKEDKEVFESSLDKAFQKFADRIGQNPEQVLRYEFNGKPLLYSDTDDVGKQLAPCLGNTSKSNAKVTAIASRSDNGIPRCQNCGAERVFEVQLTPHAITELEVEEMSIDGMEWGTIILGVCSLDCRPKDIPIEQVGYLEEWIGVQWEEVASRK